jgi:hypothetical protein
LFGFLCHWLDLDLAFTIFLLLFLRRSWALALVQSSLIGSSNCPAAAAVFFRVRFFCFLQVALCASVEWLFLLLIWILSSLILLPLCSWSLCAAQADVLLTFRSRESVVLVS